MAHVLGTPRMCKFLKHCFFCLRDETQTTFKADMDFVDMLILIRKVTGLLLCQVEDFEHICDPCISDANAVDDSEAAKRMEKYRTLDINDCITRRKSYANAAETVAPKAIERVIVNERMYGRLSSDENQKSNSADNPNDALDESTPTIATLSSQSSNVQSVKMLEIPLHFDNTVKKPFKGCLELKRKILESMKPKNICPKCSLKFSFKVALDKHILLRHSKEEISASVLDAYCRWKGRIIICF